MKLFSVVIHNNYKELGRSKGMQFDKALKLTKYINKNCNPKSAYVEETQSVKHLPVIVN